MIIIGADYHPAFQQIAFVDSETGELKELRLEHREEAEKFYHELAAQGMKVRVGMEASGHARWFERLLAELHFELWIGRCGGDPHQADTEAEDGSPGCAAAAAIATGRSLSPDLGARAGENRDLRQLLWHRHRMVQTRTRLMNQLQAVALNEGLRRKKGLWREAGREATRVVSVSPVGESATARLAGVAGSAEPDDCGTERSHRRGSREVSRGAALADASRGGFSDRAGFRVDRRRGGAVPVRQADCELSGTGAVGGVERRSTTAGTHHQTGQRAVAFPVGGGGASHGPQRPGMAQPVFPSGPAAGTEDCQGGHGP